MNNLSKACVLACSLLIASAASAGTNEIVKQVKEWGSDLEHRLAESESSNVKLQKQLDKMSAQLKSVEADRDSLKTELTQSKKAMTVAEKEAISASRRAEKAERQLTRQSDKTERKAVKRNEAVKQAIEGPDKSSAQKVSTDKIKAQKEKIKSMPASTIKSSTAGVAAVIPAMKNEPKSEAVVVPAATVVTTPAEPVAIVVDGVLTTAPVAVPGAPDVTAADDVTMEIEQ